jgi:hypothetical protein
VQQWLAKIMDCEGYYYAATVRAHPKTTAADDMFLRYDDTEKQRLENAV